MVYAAMGALGGVDTSHLALFQMPNVTNIRGHLLAQDVIYVGGGSVANLLALWRLHGVDHVMREAWESGVVLTGVSAGSICWHIGGPTDSFGAQLRPVTNGLGLLPYGNGVHYDSEEQRRPLLHRPSRTARCQCRTPPTTVLACTTWARTGRSRCRSTGSRGLPIEALP